MTYQIYALRYAGPLSSSGAFVLWLRDWDKEVLRNYYIWCISNDSETIIVDTGVAPDAEGTTKLNGYRRVDEALRLIDVKAETVRTVILTHLHFDHAGGISLFPNADFFVQRNEYDFWLSDPVARKAPLAQLINTESLLRLEKLRTAGRVELLDGESEIVDGIRCIPAPGHTPGLQVVSVETEAGTAVIASDCGHFFQSFEEEWPSCLICDLPSWLKSFEAVKTVADSPMLIFPGHDVRLIDDYPAAADGVSLLI